MSTKNSQAPFFHSGVASVVSRVSIVVANMASYPEISIVTFIVG